jgi:hypothetical protein
MHFAKDPDSHTAECAEASASITTPARPVDADGLDFSRKKLAELARELDAYLAFWAYARDARVEGPGSRERG